MEKIGLKSTRNDPFRDGGERLDFGKALNYIEENKEEFLKKELSKNKLIIGIDYGREDEESHFVVSKKIRGVFHVLDSGRMEDFDYSKYVASEHQVTGERDCLEKFKEQFLKGGTYEQIIWD